MSLDRDVRIKTAVADIGYFETTLTTVLQQTDSIA